MQSTPNNLAEVEESLEKFSVITAALSESLSASMNYTLVPTVKVESSSMRISATEGEETNKRLTNIRVA